MAVHHPTAYTLPPADRTFLQLCQPGTQFLLFWVFPRCFVEVAERAVDVLVGGCRGVKAGLRSGVSGGIFLSSVQGVRLPSGCFARSLRSLPSGHFTKKGTQTLHRTVALLLFPLHYLLLVGFLLITDQFGCHRVRDFRVEALCLFPLFFLRRSEDEPHRACKKQKHQGINDKFLSPLSLFLRQLRRGARIEGRLSFEWEHNRNTLIG